MRWHALVVTLLLAERCASDFAGVEQAIEGKAGRPVNPHVENNLKRVRRLAASYADAKATFATSIKVDQLPDNLKMNSSCTEQFGGLWTYVLDTIKSSEALQKNYGITDDRQYFASYCLEPTPEAKRIIIPKGAEKKLVVDLHNEYRAKEPAKSMLKMGWDDELAQAAAGWASQCVWAHDEQQNRQAPERFEVGQNMAHIAAPADITPVLDEWVKTLEEKFGDKREDKGQYKVVKIDDPNPPKDWTWVLKAWTNQKKDWKLGEGSINGNEVGEFTQVVDAYSYLVGCAYVDCGYGGHTWICNYGPAGNRGGFATPYEEGTPSEDCPDTKDAEGLCDCTNTMIKDEEMGYDLDCLPIFKKNPNTCQCDPLYKDLVEKHTNRGKVCEPVKKGACTANGYATCPDGTEKCCCDNNGDIVQVEGDATCKWSTEDGKCGSTAYCSLAGDMSDIVDIPTKCDERRSVIDSVVTHRRR